MGHPATELSASSSRQPIRLAHHAETQRRLCRFNELRLRPALDEGDDVTWRMELAEEQRVRLLEERFVEQERASIAARAASAPTDAEAFVRWFESLEQDGPGQHDALFAWLEGEATLDEMRWFLTQEIAGEAGFDDLVALTQLKMPQKVKLELARNYWDELGRGHASGMHGPMLARLAKDLGIDDGPDAAVCAESLALGNLLVAFAMNRRYAYHSIGALGVIELTAPGRARCVNAGLKRLGAHARTRQYFALHATLDILHAESYKREVLGPLVAEEPRRARAIAEGALMRLAAGERCFERYRRELGIGCGGARGA